MKLNKKLEIGINAIKSLKVKNGPVRIFDLAPEIGTTTTFLEQIMRDLRIAGLISVKKGPGGGYQLSNPLSDITAYQVGMAVGRDLDASSFSTQDTPTNRLKSSILEAFLNTKI